MEGVCKSMCGLFVSNSNTPVPLTKVDYNVDIHGYLGRVTISQIYKNEEATDLECVYGFPINDQAGIIGFTVEIDGRTLTSQFKQKDEAFKEYSEALSRGDGAYLLDQSDRSDDTFVLSVGRLPPGKECAVAISYVYTLEAVTETKMRLVIPTSLSPRYNPNPSVSTGGVVPPETYQNTVPYFATLKGTIHAIEVVNSVTSPTHPLAVTLIDPKTVSVEFGAKQQPLDRDFILEIEVKNNPQHHVEVEMTEPGKYAAVYAFIPHESTGTAAAINSELIFLVDCSGSMHDENKIEDAKRAMQIFLRSIPEGCVFNFYRFGSTFHSLFPTSQKYSQESFNQAKDYTNDTSANLGGTGILAPLQAIFANAAREGFSRQLFVLTDGDVSNTEAVIDLVRSNAHNTRVFSFGLGQSPSRSLVNGIALAGNGKSEFIKQGEVLEDKIGRHLSRALQPAVTNATVKWEGVKNVKQVPTNLPPVFYGDRQLAFAFFELEETAENPSVVLRTGNSSTKLAFPVRHTEKAEQLFISKMAARALIKQIETSPTDLSPSGSLQKRIKSKDTVKNNDSEEQITQISLEYGVMSKYVSLVAVERRDEPERKGASAVMQLREIPVQKAARVPPPVQLFSLGQRLSRSAHQPSLKKRLACLPMFGSQRAAAVPENSGASSWHGDESICDTAMSMACSDQLDLLSFGMDYHEVESDAIMQQASHATTATTTLNALLDLQLWNGTWTFSEQLERMLNITALEVEQALNGIATLPDVLATILTAAYIEATFPEQINVWQAIVTKAKTYVAKNADEQTIVAITAAIRSLIASKRPEIKWNPLGPVLYPF